MASMNNEWWLYGTGDGWQYAAVDRRGGHRELEDGISSRVAELVERQGARVREVIARLVPAWVTGCRATIPASRATPSPSRPPLLGYRVVTADEEVGLLRLGPQRHWRSGFSGIGERVTEDLESLVRLDENRHGLVAHRVVSHH